MAINFTGVNGGNGWQDSPSVATPVSAANLNIDEQGIKDLVAAINNNFDIQSGSWAPTIVGGGTGAITGTALYYKIGKLVHISGFLYINMSAVTSDILMIGGLPFTIGAIRTIFSVGYANLPNLSGYLLEGVINETTIGVQKSGVTAVYAGNSLTTGVDYIIQFSGIYDCV